MRKYYFLVLISLLLFSCQNFTKEISLLNQEITKINNLRNPGDFQINNVVSIKQNSNLFYCYDQKGNLITALEKTNGYLIGEIKQEYSYHKANGYREWGDIIHQVKIKYE